MRTWLFAILLCAPAAPDGPVPAGPAAVVEELLRRFPDSPPATLAAARIAHRSGSLDRAFDLFGRTLSLDAGSFEAREARGDILTLKGRRADAAAEYREAASRSAGPREAARARLKRAMALLALGESEAAEKELREAIAKFPGESGLHYQLGQALLARGDSRAAVNELEEARRLGEPARSVEYALAQAWLRAGDPDAAAAALARFRALRIETPEGDDARAQRDADRRKLDRRNLALAHLDAAAVFRHHRLPAEARAHIEAALAGDPDFHAARVLRAELAVESGDLAAACEDYERLLLAAADPSLVRGVLGRLRERFELVVIEGAGSPAEINLRERDIVNMKIAELADAPVILSGDIERGGVFASLVGTMELLEPAERRRVRGYLINKFRGDPSLLGSGLSFLEERTGVPVLGVLPYVFGLPVDEEDAVGFESSRRGPPPETSEASEVLIGVIRLPHISNATDFQPLERAPGVAVRYIDCAEDFGEPDLVVLPGTKSTVADFEWLHRQGLAVRIREHAARGGWVLGLCGGYQMLGREILDEDAIESGRRSVAGLGLLPVTTTFEPEKRLAQVEAVCLLPGLEGARVRGYEIHQGRTSLGAGASPAFRVERVFGEPAAGADDGAGSSPSHFGTYLHGLFDHSDFRGRFLNVLRQHKGLTPLPRHGYDTRARSFDDLADLLADHVDLKRVSGMLGLPLDSLHR